MVRKSISGLSMFFYRSRQRQGGVYNGFTIALMILLRPTEETTGARAGDGYESSMKGIDKETQGAWIVHHGRKIALDVGAPAEFPALDETAKATELLIRLGESEETTLGKKEVEAVARAAHLNPRSELPHFLQILEKRRLIDRAADEVRVLGLTNRAALRHAADMLADAEPSPFELAAIDLGELTSKAPQNLDEAKEYIGDNHAISTSDTEDFIQRSVRLGFVDFEGEGKEGLLFNGNLFKRDTVAKSNAVLSSLSSEEQGKVTEFSDMLKRHGCILADRADEVLGRTLFEKLKAAGVFEVNTVSNEHGDHAFVNSPGAFHKFVNPLIDDSFDLAKALVTALTYGLTQRSSSQGRIISIDWLLGALIRGRTVGPATAIGNDYRVLEQSRVVQVIPGQNGMFSMRLLKKEVGVLALQVLKNGDANAESVRVAPGSPMSGYVGPETNRAETRRRQKAPSKRATRDVISALRGGRGI